MRIRKEAIGAMLIRQIIRIVKIVIAVAGASALFSILPLARGALRVVAKEEAVVTKKPIMIMQKIKKEEKQIKQPMKQTRAFNKSSTNRNIRSTGFSMRFTPDLSAGSSGDGVGMVAAVAGADAVFEEGDVDEPPKPISRMVVEYPRRAREAGIEGIVSLIILIGRNGNVIDVSVESAPSPLFIKPVQQTVRQWKFHPARNQGVSVKVRMRQNIAFKLD